MRSEVTKGRFTFLMLFCIFAAGMILLRAGYIQLPGNNRLEKMALRQYNSKSLIQPRRGSILDRNGEPLAINIETNSLAANPSKIKNKHWIARLLSKSTDIPISKILPRLSDSKEFVWIKRHISEAEMKRFRKWNLMDSEGNMVEGLWWVKESERVYPHGQLASHILGDVNVDSQGLEGAELWWNEKLRGKVVSVASVKDAFGRPTFIDTEAAKNVQDGESISLTIDAPLQFEVEKHLHSAIQKTNAKSGTVIVMNADTGDILALANEPTFNPSQKRIPLERRRNRAFTDGYEPGSTFKAVLLAAALSQGWKLNDVLYGEKGSFQVQGHRITEAESHEKFGWISLKKMIQVSSNVIAAKLALKLGSEKYAKMIRTFGFGAKTGSGFPGEISGRVSNKKDWSPLTLANIGFGQGLLVTPIQMARAYAVLLNGGWLIQPRLVREDRSDQKPFQRPVKILSSRVSAEAIEALEKVTQEGGTGQKAALPGYRVAGKTGTAQMVDPSTGRYSREKYISSFIGFPVGVEPKIVIFTSISEPKGSYYASVTAAPLFKEVLASVANRFSLPFQMPQSKLLADKGASADDAIRISQAAAIPEIHFEPHFEDGPTGKGWIMPSLKGLSPREAMKIIKGHRVRVELTGTGIVSHQMPESGKNVAEGDLVRLILTEP